MSDTSILKTDIMKPPQNDEWINILNGLKLSSFTCKTSIKGKKSNNMHFLKSVAQVCNCP